ncbi:LOW QUALITY PROTEIN: hypothetical protein PanWU01x14_249140, partial [Parasponia andersonii]
YRASLCKNVTLTFHITITRKKGNPTQKNHELKLGTEEKTIWLIQLKKKAITGILKTIFKESKERKKKSS